MTAKKDTPAKKAALPTKTAATKTAATKAPAKKATPAKKAPAKKATPAKDAVSSRFFRRAQKRAEVIVKDPEKLQKIAEESYKSGAARSGPFQEVMDDFRALIRLVVAYARGNYRAIPADSLVVIIAGLVYVVSPVDLVPDVLPGGFVDDAVVVAWVVKMVRGELEAFRAWELGSDAP